MNPKGEGCPAPPLTIKAKVLGCLSFGAAYAKTVTKERHITRVSP